MARMFAAVRLPESSLRSLAEAQHALERRIIDVKWVEEENLHFTLRFFGELTPDELSRAIEAATTVTEMTPAFTIEIAGLGAFPEQGRPRVLWAGVEAGRERLVSWRRRSTGRSRPRASAPPIGRSLPTSPWDGCGIPTRVAGGGRARRRCRRRRRQRCGKPLPRPHVSG